MEDFWVLILPLLNILIPLAIIILAMVVGSILEKNHFTSIREREAKLMRLPAIPSKSVDPDRRIAQAKMVTGSVVVSIDHFKRFLAGFRMIFGGHVRSYETIIDRGRREAVLRMKEAFPDADIIVNFRMETSTISKQGRGGKQAVGCIEMLAYGTAIQYEDTPSV